MKEDFLHYIWQYQLLDLPLLSVDEEEIIVLQPGQHNIHSGPDFLDARIKIGQTLWAGNVEIHLKSSDWRIHQHHKDKAYNNVILHVVYEDDKPVEGIPTVIINTQEVNNRYKRYHSLLAAKEGLPCQKALFNIKPVELVDWLNVMAVERLEEKTALVEESLSLCMGDWESTFYQLLIRNFGFSTNSIPFEILGKQLDFKLLKRVTNQSLTLEALLFGTAGLLDGTFKEQYPTALKEEFKHLKNKHKLTPMEPSIWKFMRMRPVNFPTIRIAQLAALIHHQPQLLSNIIEAKDITTIIAQFQTTPHPFWENHYSFKQPTKQNRQKRLGKTAIDLIIINTLAPFLFVYGTQLSKPTLCDKALMLLEKTESEKNRYTRKWASFGIIPKNALDSQALLHISKNYCSKKQCLQCRVGKRLLQ